MPKIKNKFSLSVIPLVFLAIIEIFLVGIFKDSRTEYLTIGLILFGSHICIWLIITYFQNRFCRKLYFFYLWGVILWSFGTMFPERNELFYTVLKQSNYQDLVVKITCLTVIYAFGVIVFIYEDTFNPR